MMKLSAAATLLLLQVFHPCLHAADWPRWRGADQNGISEESDWQAKFPDGKAKVAWKKNVGTGFSSVVVAGGSLLTMGNDGGTETVWCFDALSGEEKWKFEFECPLDPKYFEGGPTSTPTVDGDTVYTLSRRGHLHALDVSDGDLRWSKDLATEYGMPIPSWGFAGSPFVQADRLYLNIGSQGMALKKEDGELVWKSDQEEAGYSTAVPFASGGKDYLLLGCRRSWKAVEADTGEELWSQRWLTRYGVNAADPIVSGDQIWVSSGYGKGAALLKWYDDDDPEIIWQNKELRTQMNPAVLIDGHLYGIDGDAGDENALKCLDFATGEVKWSVADVGSGGVTAADGRLIVLGSRGELMVAPASPEKFEPTARAQVLQGKCWTVPVLANARIYCRNAAGDLVCVDVSR